jgi:hypothetical protein
MVVASRSTSTGAELPSTPRTGLSQGGQKRGGGDCFSIPSQALWQSGIYDDMPTVKRRGERAHKAAAATGEAAGGYGRGDGLRVRVSQLGL